MKNTKTLDWNAIIELELYTENNGQLYDMQTKFVIANLAKKYAKGVYNTEKAVKVWEYIAENASKMYTKEFAYTEKWYELFPKAERFEVAKRLETYYFENINGENPLV